MTTSDPTTEHQPSEGPHLAGDVTVSERAGTPRRTGRKLAKLAGAIILLVVAVGLAQRSWNEMRQLPEPPQTHIDAAVRCQDAGGRPLFNTFGRNFVWCSFPDGTEIRSVHYF